MERIELAVSGLEQALRPRPAREELPTIGRATSRPAGAEPSAAPAWLEVARQQLPFLTAAVLAEHPETSSTMAARCRRLQVERDRLVERLQAVARDVAGATDDPSSTEELRRTLLRLVRDVGHHHQKVNDLLYDHTWRDVGGSE